MPWLVCDAHVLASAEVADDRAARRRGLLGRDHLDGALVLRPCKWVHTVGMRFAIDVACCDRALVVRHLAAPLPPGRLVLPRWGVVACLEAEAGAFARWGVTVGSSLALAPVRVGCAEGERVVGRRAMGRQGVEVGHDG